MKMTKCHNIQRIAFLFILWSIYSLSFAVLKERDLGRTLGVLRLELYRSYNAQKSFMLRYETRSKQQHQQLIENMQKSEQVGLMLYSQNTEFTFDVAYACQEATDLYRSLKTRTMPFEQMKTRLLAEIARYDSLIVALESLPPSLNGRGFHGSRRKRLHRNLIGDSLVVLNGDTVSIDSLRRRNPFLLSDNEQKDRSKCILYAKALRNNYVRLLNSVTLDNEYYTRVTEQISRQYAYAQQRYDDLQQSIFRNGGYDYITILSRLPFYLKLVVRDFSDKYLPLGKTSNYSEWRGPIVLSVSVFMLIYIILAVVLSNLLIRGLPWLMKKCFPGLTHRISRKINKHIVNKDEFRKKYHMIVWVFGIALFAIAIMVARGFLYRNLFIMAADLMINLAWLMLAIFVSLLIRLSGDQIIGGIKLYLPFIFMAFIVILFRIILIPNSLVNLIYPPLLLIFVIWQIYQLRRSKNLEHPLPLSDSLYSNISLIAMVVGCVLSWVGYTLFAVQIMIWWTFQLAAIQTITCLYDLTQVFEDRILINRIVGADAKRTAESDAQVVKQMYKGVYFMKTWSFDFVRIALIPVLAVLSVLFSIWSAASLFEMTSIVKDVFLYKFVDVKDTVQLSLSNICLVVALFFIFKYLNYAICSYYEHWQKRANHGVESDNDTLLKNVITIIVWGFFIWISLVLLQVPKKGISVILAGLVTGMGFAMKDLLENFFYGISLMTGRLKVGDFIECDGIQGKVDSIGYQSTQILTLDGAIIAFLNSALFNKNFKNLTKNHEYEMVKIPVGIAYGSNVNEVRKIITEAIEPLCKKRDSSRRLIVDNKKPIRVAFADFGDNSVNLNVIIWVLVDQKPIFIANVKEAIYEALNENHVEIPFPQRDIYIRQVSGVVESGLFNDKS